METRTSSLASQITGTSNWLQLFAEPAAPAPSATPGATTVPPAPAPAPAVATPGATPINPGSPPLVGNLSGQGTAATPAPAAQAPAPVAEPPMLDFGGRKLPDTPDNRALHEDWKRQQAALTKAQQDLLRFKQMGTQAPPAPQAAPAQAAPQAQQPQVQQPAQPVSAGDVTAALLQMGITPDQFQSALYGDSPLQAVAQVAQAVAQQQYAKIQEQFQQVQPVLQRADQWITQAEVNQRIDAVAAQHADFNQYLPQMVQMFDQYKELNSLPNGVEVAYLMAKGLVSQPATQAPAAADLLKDESVRAQILQDPQIRESIIQEHLRSIAVRGPSAPVMAGPVAAAAPTLPASTPKDLNEATKRLLARWGAMGVNQ